MRGWKPAKGTCKLTFKSDGADIAEPLPVMRDEAVSAVDAGLRRKLEKAEQTIDELNKGKAVLESQIKALEKKKDAAQIVAREATESRQENTTALEGAHAQLNTMQVDLPRLVDSLRKQKLAPSAWFAVSTSWNTKSANEQPNWPKPSVMPEAVRN